MEADHYCSMMMLMMKMLMIYDDDDLVSHQMNSNEIMKIKQKVEVKRR